MYRDIEPAPSRQRTGPGAGRSVIAVIGIDQYVSWSRLSNAVSDAEGAAQLFEQLGFEQVTAPLLDGAATREAMHHLVTGRLTQLAPDDSLVLFFAGHGHTHTTNAGDAVVKTGYVIPVDATHQVADAASTWLRLDSWLSDIARLPPRHILVIIDACHSGCALTALHKWREETPWPTTRLEALWARRSRRVITSALDGQRAMDSGPFEGHSLFTGCLIEGLSGRLGKGRKRVTTGRELGQYLHRRVTTFPGSTQMPDVGAFELDDRGDMLIPVLADQVGKRASLAAPPQRSQSTTLRWSGPTSAARKLRERESPVEHEALSRRQPPEPAGRAGARRLEPRGMARSEAASEPAVRYVVAAIRAALARMSGLGSRHAVWPLIVLCLFGVVVGVAPLFSGLSAHGGGTPAGSTDDVLDTGIDPNMKRDGSAEALGPADVAKSNASPNLIDTVIDASVPGAVVEIIGTSQAGPVPFVARLERGKAYKARVVAHRFATVELDVRGGDDKQTAKLVAKPGFMSISTEPTGALIAIDGTLAGRTPAEIELTFAQVAKKSVHVVMRKPGFRVIDHMVSLANFVEDDTKLEARLDEKLVPARARAMQ